MTPLCYSPITPNFLRKPHIWENSRSQNLWQKGPKKGKNRVFGFLRKIESLVFARNDLEWSVLWLANFLHTPHVWENSHSRDYVGKLSTSQITRFFKLLYLLNRSNVLYFLDKIEYLKTFKMMFSLFWKKFYLPPKNQQFCISLKIGSLDFFYILYEVRDY